MGINTKVIKDFLKTYGTRANAGKAALISVTGAAGFAALRAIVDPLGTAKSAMTLKVEYRKRDHLRRQADASQKMYDLQLKMYNDRGSRNSIPLHQRPLRRPLI